MGLLTDFYNTVARFFRPQEEITNSDNSKSVATNRLKLVLMQDRTNLTPKVLEQMRGELVDLLSKYLEMDKDMLELNFEHEGDQVALMLSIPVIRAKEEEEIEEIIYDITENEEVEDSTNSTVDYISFCKDLIKKAESKKESSEEESEIDYKQFYEDIKSKLEELPSETEDTENKEDFIEEEEEKEKEEDTIEE